jgi:hypothetical protein
LVSGKDHLAATKIAVPIRENTTPAARQRLNASMPRVNAAKKVSIGGREITKAAKLTPTCDAALKNMRLDPATEQKPAIK